MKAYVVKTSVMINCLTVLAGRSTSVGGWFGGGEGGGGGLLSCGKRFTTHVWHLDPGTRGRRPRAKCRRVDGMFRFKVIVKVDFNFIFLIAINFFLLFFIIGTAMMMKLIPAFDWFRRIRCRSFHLIDPRCGCCDIQVDDVLYDGKLIAINVNRIKVDRPRRGRGKRGAS